MASCRFKLILKMNFQLGCLTGQENNELLTKEENVELKTNVNEEITSTRLYLTAD